MDPEKTAVPPAEALNKSESDYEASSSTSSETQTSSIVQAETKQSDISLRLILLFAAMSVAVFCGGLVRITLFISVQEQTHGVF